MKALFTTTLLFLCFSSIAQKASPVIKATSSKVTVKDGTEIDKYGWTLSPRTKPDVYMAYRTRQTKWVTFYTDIDSIQVKVKPGTRYNFVVLLNQKDSCYTQIASAIQPETDKPLTQVKNDTIAFKLTDYNAISIKATLDHRDTLNVHFDLSSYGFHITREVIPVKTHLLSNQPDALAGKAKPNYNKLAQVSDLQMGTAVWRHPEILPTALAAHGMDGRLGWTWFDGKVVSLNYDTNQLIISDLMPRYIKGYVKEKLTFIRSLPCVKGVFKMGNKRYEAYFSMDNGSEQSMILDGAWRQQQHFPADLKVLKTSVLRDGGGNEYKTEYVQAPPLTLGGKQLTGAPALLIGERTPGGTPVNFLGNDVLKRFNIIIDFKHDVIYWRPNGLFDADYRKV